MTPDLTPVHEVQLCAKHPEREATLRCIRCNRLMCTDCIVRTPVGYVCKECSRRAEDKFFAAANQDYVLQAATCFVVMAVICALFTQVPFVSTFLSVILGPLAGGMAAEIAMRLSGRRRGRYTDIIGTVAAGLGGLAGHMGVIVFEYQQAVSTVAPAMRSQYTGVLVDQLVKGTVLDIWFLIFLGCALAGTYARLRGRI